MYRSYEGESATEAGKQGRTPASRSHLVANPLSGFASATARRKFTSEGSLDVYI
jgi:hypothetical protein